MTMEKFVEQNVMKKVEATFSTAFASYKRKMIATDANAEFMTDKAYVQTLGTRHPKNPHALSSLKVAVSSYVRTETETPTLRTLKPNTARLLTVKSFHLRSTVCVPK